MKTWNRVAFFIVFSMGLLSSAAQAQKPYRVELGSHIEIDVAYQSNIPVIVYAVHPASEPAPALEARVVQEVSGFECEVVEARELKPFVLPKSTLNSATLFTLSWVPGADTSGCLVEVSAPGSALSTTVRLFMAY